MTGTETFCRIRGYISTLKKRGLPVWESLQQAYEGHPLLSPLSGCDPLLTAPEPLTPPVQRAQTACTV